MNKHWSAPPQPFAAVTALACSLLVAVEFAPDDEKRKGEASPVVLSDLENLPRIGFCSRRAGHAWPRACRRPCLR
jgi:hypothetical protein